MSVSMIRTYFIIKLLMQLDKSNIHPKKCSQQKPLVFLKIK